MPSRAVHASARRHRSPRDRQRRHFFDPEDLSGWDPSAELGFPGEFPFTRGIQPTMYRGRLWTMRQYAGFGTAAESNRRYRYLLDAGRQRPERRLRPADADGLRLGPSARRGRGRPGRRRDRLDRGHGAAVRRHPARPRLDVDDDQRDRDHPARALHRGRPAAGRCRRRRCRARSRTTSSRSTSRAAPTSIRRAPSLRIVTDIFAFCERELPNWNTISISGYHIREAGSTAVAGGGVHVRATRIAYVAGGASTPGSTSTSSASGSRSSSTRTTTSSRRSRSSAPRGGCGRASCATGSARRNPARAAAPLPHPDRRQHADRAAARQQHRARRASRRWRRCSAARSRCTATAATRRSACRPRSRRGSRCARSRSSRARAASPTRVDPLGGVVGDRALTNRIEREAVAMLDRIDAAGGTLAAIEQGLIQREIQESAYRAQLAIDSRRRRSSSA